jgi:PAS domain-containing protein
VAISSERDERFAAYAESLVWIDHPTAGQLVMMPREGNEIEGVFPAAAGATIHVITSHNPGRLLPAAENHARHVTLASALEAVPGLEVWRSVGGDTAWVHTEEGVATVGMTDQQACELGRRFGQEAIWAWDAWSLRLVSCDDASEVVLGWTVEPWTGQPKGP